MCQLKYDYNFEQIIEDIPYWNRASDIPDHITSYIKDLSKAKLIYNRRQEKFYCFECLNELDDNLYCKNCDINYKEQKDDEDWIAFEHTGKYQSSDSVNMYVFDVYLNKPILYLLNMHITYSYYSHMAKTFKNYEMEICDVFLIEEDGFTSLSSCQFYDFKEYYKQIYNNKYEDITIQDKYKNLPYLRGGVVYVDNLEQLKNTVYRYSFLWKAKEFLKVQNEITLEQLIFLPIYFPQFEYLMKNNLFNLAFFSANVFERDKSFQDIFKIDKKYLPFIIENNITWKELQLLRVYPTTDINLIRFFTKFEYYRYDIIDIVENHKVDLKEFRDYLLSIESYDEYISEYFDYIYMASDLGLDMSDKKVLYPKNLFEKHSNLFLQTQTLNDPNIDSKIKHLSNILSLNCYEDNEYKIYPASSIADLVEESIQQHNCVRTYCDRIASNECNIYFMRKKKELDKSFVTIEVRDKYIVQARLKYNELPDREIEKILNKWEKTLISITDEIW